MSGRWVVVLGLTGIAVVAVVHGVLLATPGVPAGIDGGNWLAYADSIWGRGVREGLVYPPLVPLLSRGFVDLLGPTLGIAVLGSSLAALPSLVVFAIVAAAGRPVVAAGAGMLIAAGAPLGETLAWGGFPQLLGLAAAIVAVWGLAGWLLAGRSAHAVAASLGWLVVIGSSHLIALPAAVAALLLTPLVVVASPSTGSLRRALLAAGTALAIALPLAPVYLKLAAEYMTAPPASVPGLAELERVLGPGWPLWWAALLLGPISAALAWRGGRWASIGPRGRQLALTGVALALGWTLVVVVTGQPRYFHDLGALAPLSVAAAMVMLASYPRRIRAAVMPPVRAVAAAGTAVIVVGGLMSFPSQRDYYQVLEPATLSAIEWIGDHSAPNAIIAVPDDGGAPLGWWVEGLAGHPTIFASDLRWLRYSDERERASAAGRLFYGAPFPSDRTTTMATASGVTYILVPAEAPWAGAHEGPLPDGLSVGFVSGAASVFIVADRVPG